MAYKECPCLARWRVHLPQDGCLCISSMQGSVWWRLHLPRTLPEVFDGKGRWRVPLPLIPFVETSILQLIVCCVQAEVFCASGVAPRLTTKRSWNPRQHCPRRQCRPCHSAGAQPTSSAGRTYWSRGGTRRCRPASAAKFPHQVPRDILPCQVCGCSPLCALLWLQTCTGSALFGLPDFHVWPWRTPLLGVRPR